MKKSFTPGLVVCYWEWIGDSDTRPWRLVRTAVGDEDGRTPENTDAVSPTAEFLCGPEDEFGDRGGYIRGRAVTFWKWDGVAVYKFHFPDPTPKWLAPWCQDAQVKSPEWYYLLPGGWQLRTATAEAARKVVVG